MRLQGQIDTDLNETGQGQAKGAGQALKDVAFNKVYCSPLKRAHLTCQLILEQNEKSAIGIGDVHKEPRLMERNFGSFENMLCSEIKELAEKANFTGDAVDLSEDGESREDVIERARLFLMDCIVPDAQLDNPCLLVVSHAGLIRALFQVLFEEMSCSLPPSVVRPIDLTYNSKTGPDMPNTSWSKFTLDICGRSIKAIQCHEFINFDHLK